MAIFNSIPVHAVVVLIGGLMAVKVLSILINTKLTAWANRTTSQWDDVVILLLKKRIIPFLYFFVVIHSVMVLPIPANIPPFLQKLLIGLGAIISALASLDLIKAILDLKISGISEQGHKGIITLVRAVIWSLATLFILDNLGFKVTSIIAGLGIGGVAVALAAQTLLSDVFNYFAILFDQPFEVGDFVIVGDISGTIESMGLKSTKIRSLVGEQIILSNTQLMNTKLHNFKRMDNRRVVFQLGVEYSTTYEKLQAIPSMITKIMSGIAGVTLDRCHFCEYAASSLNFEIVYFVSGSDFKIHMDKKQEIFMAIFKEFEAAKINFAFPTSTVHLVQA
ncbi:MAG: mechanosensitive ion channel family protein [Bdellovibrio sp.]|nr:mechanosensitive ion channel family protein [Bdellovibrio sp.]